MPAPTTKGVPQLKHSIICESEGKRTLNLLKEPQVKLKSAGIINNSQSAEFTVCMTGPELQPADIVQDDKRECCDMIISSPSDTLYLILHIAESLYSQVYKAAELADKEAVYHTNVATVFNYRLNNVDLECISSIASSIQSSLALLESSRACLVNLATSLSFHLPTCQAGASYPLHLRENERGPISTTQPNPSPLNPAVTNSSVSSGSIEPMAEGAAEEGSHVEGRGSDNRDEIFEAMWNYQASDKASSIQADILGAHLEATSACPNHVDIAKSPMGSTNINPTLGPSLEPAPKLEVEKKQEVKAETEAERKSKLLQVLPCNHLLDTSLKSLPAPLQREGGLTIEKEVIVKIVGAIIPENKKGRGKLSTDNKGGGASKSRRRKLEQKVEGDCNTWRKYGEKQIKDASFYRSYYRCAFDSTCKSRREVDRFKDTLAVVSCKYTGGPHTHPIGAKKNRKKQAKGAQAVGNTTKAQ